jgi:hypothetical protein
VVAAQEISPPTRQDPSRSEHPGHGQTKPTRRTGNDTRTALERKQAAASIDSHQTVTVQRQVFPMDTLLPCVP